ncbi:MAG: hypothetical protein IT258_02695 [Saprospiraceae bacterium]|nr:hypothetical protein [Saprospiraceae bacterium]
MKNLLFSLALIFVAFSAMGQTTEAPNPKAREATEKLTKTYSLSPEQQAEMYKIQERKLRNLSEVESLKASDPSTYIAKIRSIQKGHHLSLERLLNADQIKIFRDEQHDLRMRKSTAYKELSSSGASQQEIDRKMIDFDIEALQ